MRRRSFVFSFAGLAALVGVGGWRVAKTNQQEAIIDVVRKRLGYLRIDDADLKRFANDLVASHKISPIRLKALAAVSPIYEHLGLTGHEGWLETVRHGEERITTSFLLSSDFFKKGANTSLPVRYLGPYDPMIPCNTPFARLVPTFEPPAEKAPTLPAAAAATAAAR